MSNGLPIVTPPGPGTNTEPVSRRWLDGTRNWPWWRTSLCLVLVTILFLLVGPIVREGWAIRRLQQFPGVWGLDPDISRMSPRLSFPAAMIARVLERVCGPDVWPPRTYALELENVPRDELPRLRAIRVVESLRVTSSEVLDEDMDVLRGLAHLRTLRLATPRVTPQGLLRLRGLPVTELELALPEFGNDHLAAAIAAFPHLTDLILNGSHVDDAGLVALRSHRSLQRLYLNQTRVTNTRMADLATLPALTDLSLSGTSIDDGGIATLTKSRSLTNLSLNGTNITDAGLALFPSGQTYRYLNLSETMISDSGLVLLRSDIECLFVNKTMVRFDIPAARWVLGQSRLTIIDARGNTLSAIGVDSIRASRRAYLRDGPWSGP